jgi:glycosyltransferase involved in cell wall biosynthesis
MSRPTTHDWLVLQEGDRRRWGGDLRRAFIFRELAERSGATIGPGWSPAIVRAGLATASGPHRLPSLRRRRPLVASAESLGAPALHEVRRRAVPFALDVHDDPVAQFAAVGVNARAERLLELRAGFAANLNAFAWHVAPSATFAELTGLVPDRTILAPNGTDTSHVRPGPLPAEPTIGFISGAAPGRGIETLVEAARLVREQLPGVRLRLWLVATGESGRGYLEALGAELAADAWIRIGPAPYEQLGQELAGATVLCIPHPANAYLDSAMPVKLFDSMAAGRPLVVTPRTETRAVVERADAGLVASGERAEDLAAALLTVLADPQLAARLGANGRAAAERDYDWSVIGDRLADELLLRADS